MGAQWFTSSSREEEEMAPSLEVIECPKGDGTCYIPEAGPGKVMVVRGGVLRAVSRTEVDDALAGRVTASTPWREVEVREAAFAAADGGETEEASTVSIIDGDGDGIYVKCQPCGHTWIQNGT